MSPILGIIASQDYVRIPPSSYESIATATPSGVTSVTFSSIPSTYTSLQIRGIAATSADAVFYLRFNGDTGSNYSRHSLYGGSTTGLSFGDANVTEIGQIRASDTAGIYSGSIIDIHDYASTTRNKTVRLLTGCDFNGTGIIMMSSGNWRNTDAVTSVTLRSDSNFSSGTVFSLYGIKGA